MADDGRGATPVNDDLEVGYDEDFERRWIGVQYVGLILMMLFALACVGGLLGRGPYSHHTARARDLSLEVDYEPVAREQTGTQITLHLSNPGVLPQQVGVFVAGRVVEPMGLSGVQPRPDSAAAVGNGIVLRFTVAPREAGAPIRLNTMPGQFGLVRMEAWVVPGPADALSADMPDAAHVVRWTQLVLP